MARNLKNMENETQILFDLEYGLQNAKTQKMRNTQYTLQDLEYGEKTENYGKLKKKKKTRLQDVK